jgi:hypothetical protein
MAIVVFAVWVAMYGRTILYDKPTPPAELSPIMLAFVTWALTDAGRLVTGKDRRSIREAIGRWLLKEPNRGGNDERPE